VELEYFILRRKRQNKKMNKEMLITRILLLIGTIGAAILFFVSTFILVKTLTILIIISITYYFKKFDHEWAISLLRKVAEIKFNWSWLNSIIKKIRGVRVSKGKLLRIVSWLFLFCLVILTLSQFDLFKKIGFRLDENGNITLIILAIILGFITFYVNRKKIGAEIDKEQDEEVLAEQKRSGEFSEKFPGINRIPILRGLVRWLYKEGWWSSICVLVVLVFASSLIYPNLGGADLYHDESWHINVIDSLIRGDGFYLRNYITDEPTTSYDHGYLTNLGSYFFYSLFPGSIFWIRFFVATISLLNLLLIYLIFKSYVPKLISLLISFFTSYNIIFLYMARFLRPYPLFLTFYLLVFYFLIRLPGHTEKEDKKSLYLSLAGILVFSIGALIEREMAKILFLLLPLCSVPLIINHREVVFGLFKKINKKIIFIIIFLIIILLLFLDSFNIIHLSIVIKQIPEQLSLQTLLNPNYDYYYYLLGAQMRGIILSALLFIFGTAYLVYSSVVKNKFYTFCLLIFALVPFIISVYFLKTSEDFRYIYHLIPFFAAIIIIGIYIISIFMFNRKNMRFIFCIFFLLFMTSKPLVPFLENSNPLFIKSITKWENDDGKTYLHRRAVAPDYTRAYDYLNENQEPRDVVIINEASWNLKPQKDVSYYSVDSLWNYSKNYINSRDGTIIDFFDLVKENDGGKMWFLGAYVHMLDNNVNEYLLKNCKNVAGGLNIKMYNYTSYYENRFYWPNLFLCD